jgi:sec-independent protein translocase protein TatB
MDFGFSGELIFLALLGLILFGPRKLPEIARKAGRIAEDLKRAKQQFENQLTSEVEGLKGATKAEEASSKSLLSSLYDDLRSLNSVEPAKAIQTVLEPVRQPPGPLSLLDNASRINELLAKDGATSQHPK